MADALEAPGDKPGSASGQCMDAEALVRGILQGDRSVVVLVAHPDDESVGLGGHLRSFRKAQFLYATDGAPLDMADATAAGFSSREDYARARRAERRSALRLAGIPEEQVSDFHLIDQEAFASLVRLTRGTAACLRSTSADVIITHPYEGGHPDHDACAFAAHHARELLRAEGHPAPENIEMAFYHCRDGRMVAGELPSTTDVVELELTAEEREFKRQLFSCYPSQHHVLRQIPVEKECFRRAPQYSFSIPPHDGALLYEIFGFPVTGKMWRKAACEAEGELRSATYTTSIEP